MVLSNDPENPRVAITMKGKVKKVFQLSQPLALSGFIGEDFGVKAMLENKLEQPVHITGVDWSESTDENIKKNLEVKLEAVEEGRKYSVTVEDKKEFTKGSYHGTLILQTDFDKVREKTLDVRVLVHAEVQLYPERLLLPEMVVPRGATKSFQKVVTIIAKKGDSLKIREVVPSREDIVTTLTEVKPGKAYRCKLTIRPESRDGEYKGSIKFITNYPGYEEIEVEILGRVRVK